MNLDMELNAEQAQAVRQTEGPVLILAGAGSGKTRTIVYRMAYLLSEENVNPWNIIALTFTNKAAKEMKNRIADMVPGKGESLWVTTFHSACLRILVRYAELLGYPPKFEIADDSDQKAIIREIYKRLNINPKEYPEKWAMNQISGAKDQLMGPGEFAEENAGDSSAELIVQIYREYQADLLRNSLMDFDDLLMNAVRLFREYPELLDQYQERFRYIMVDEYQDTNRAQFEFVRLLSEKYRNICVVGDDDQSIYSFRGADVRNILDFEKYFPEAKVFRLEENYRSTANILAAANEVISNNRYRKDKKLWTEDEEGSLIRTRRFQSPEEEAAFIAEDIQSRTEDGTTQYKDFAVLIRTNIQSKELEDAFRIRRIGYEIVKGLRFWDTRVVKDLTSYLLTVEGTANDVRVLRIINLPRRGLGNSTLTKAKAFALDENISLLEACARSQDIPGLSARPRAALKDFSNLIEDLREKTREGSYSAMLDTIISDIKYMDYMKGEADSPDHFEEMKQYVEKLKETLDIYEGETENPSLIDFMQQNCLEGNALDKGGAGEPGNQVKVMTMHNAKGLEFPHVYLAGMEDGLFPSYSAISSMDPLSLEEERRLCYVGITRAEESLTMTGASNRRRNGETRFQPASRFLKEIPFGLMEPEVGAWKSRTSRDREDVKKESSTGTYTFSDKAADRLKQSLKSGLEKTGRVEKSDLEERLQKRLKMIGGLTPAKASPANPKKFQKIQLGSEIGGVKPDYQEGDRVLHFKFGEGRVQAIEKGERDYVVTVDFDQSGTKKMLAGFAKLKRV
ncbi:MAG: UvrD-helicase domain-containing protein [Lachnospiraceae bacterium]|nr:UvrD-helicase domain-containing protein [Lachnospiraceae bacterium]